MHCGGSLIGCLERYEAKPTTFASFVAHDTSADDLTKLAEMSKETV